MNQKCFYCGENSQLITSTIKDCDYYHLSCEHLSIIANEKEILIMRFYINDKGRSLYIELDNERLNIYDNNHFNNKIHEHKTNFTKLVNLENIELSATNLITKLTKLDLFK